MRKMALLLVALCVCGEADAQVFRGRLVNRSRVYRQPVPANPVRVAAANLLVADGGFEGASSAWTFTGTAGVAANGSAVVFKSPSDAPEGKQVAYIRGAGTISQTLTLAAGTYTVTMKAALAYQSRQTVSISIDGNPVGAVEPIDDWYRGYASSEFTVTAGTHTLTFRGGNRDTILFDAVTLVQTGQPAPTPIPPIPPTPVPPTPTPTPPPTPGPVTSFRVIFVTESGANLPLGAQAVQDAKIVRDYLTTNTTPEGGQPGWRQYDPQVNVTNEQPGMKALWLANKSRVTTLPAILIDVNGVVTVEPWPKPAAEVMLDTFKSRREGK